MSTSSIFRQVQKAFLKPSKTRHHVEEGNSRGRIRDVKRTKPSFRAPSIFNWHEPSVIWRKSEYQHQTKYRQAPNIRKWKMPVHLLGGDEGRAKGNMPHTVMKLRMADLKKIEKAGGLEAKMVSAVDELSNPDIDGEQELFDKWKDAPECAVSRVTSPKRSITKEQAVLGGIWYADGIGWVRKSVAGRGQTASRGGFGTWQAVGDRSAKAYKSVG